MLSSICEILNFLKYKLLNLLHQFPNKKLKYLPRYCDKINILNINIIKKLL